MHLMQEQQQSEWFATWFNSPYYHALYQDRDEQEAQLFIERLCQHLRLQKGISLLDLACGAGRHARVLHQLGFHVSGADLSANSIAAAQENAPEDLHFFVHDMRDPLPCCYNVVMNLFTSFGYFDSIRENARVMTSVYESLHPDGLFIIDFMNSEKVIRELMPRQEIKRDGIVFNIKKEVSNGRIVKTIAFQADGVSHFHQEKVQALDLIDFQQLLGDAGFEITQLFGSYTLEPFDAFHSNRLILICTKR